MQKGLKRKNPIMVLVEEPNTYRFQIVDRNVRLIVINNISKDTFEIINKSLTIIKNKAILFEFTPEEMKDITTWALTKRGKGEEKDYIYEFCPTSLGTIKIVRNTRTKAKLDLTDYEG